MSKGDGRQLGAETQEVLRLLIVDFLRLRKGTQAEAAHIFGFSLIAVKKIWKRYKQEGRKALRAKKRGPKQSTSRLSKEKIKQMKSSIKKGTPDQQGLPYHLWTAGAVRLLLKKKPR